MNRLALYVSCVALLAGCDEKDDPKPAAAPVAKDKPAAPPPTGINDPGNDPKIVELAKKALACKWENGSFDSQCAEYKAWQDEKDAFAEHKGDATIVAFFEDSDEKVRSLAVKKFFDWSGDFSDKALAERLVTVAEKAKAFNEMYPLGNVLGHTKVAETGIFPRIQALVTTTTNPPALRGTIISYLFRTNPESEEVFNLTREMIKDASKEVNGKALDAFATGGTDKTKESRCDVFLENLDNADADLAAAATELLSMPGSGCMDRYDALFKSLEARVKAKTVTTPTFINGLRIMCQDKAGTAAQMKTANGLARKLVEDKTAESSVRTYAIETAANCDPKGAKAYLGKFKKDKDPEMQSTVARLLKRK